MTPAHGGVSRSTVRLVRAIPWTTASLVVILTVALATGTLAHPPSPELLKNAGFSLEQVRAGDVWQLFTANYIVDHPNAMLSSLVLVAVMVGAYEYRYGVRWAIIVWFAGTLAATLIAVPIWHVAVVAFDGTPVSAVATAEVGSSAACWCAAGAWLGWPSVWYGRVRVLAALAIGALVTLLIVHHTFTDLEHLVAFGTGALFFGALHLRTQPRVRDIGWDTAGIGYVLSALLGLLVISLAFIAADGWLFPAQIAGGSALVGISLPMLLRDRRLQIALVLAVSLLASLAQLNVWIALVAGAAVACLWVDHRQVGRIGRAGHPGAGLSEEPQPAPNGRRGTAEVRR